MPSKASRVGGCARGGSWPSLAIVLLLAAHAAAADLPTNAEFGGTGGASRSSFSHPGLEECGVAQHKVGSMQGGHLERRRSFMVVGTGDLPLSARPIRGQEEPRGRR